jgi:molybdopterin-guanine dinucleotide biosynthesis protein A
MTFSLIINAGGRSQRMGQSKALLPTPPNGAPLLVHMLERLRNVAWRQLLIVTNDEQLPSALKLADETIYLPDRYPDTGTLGGIATGLSVCAGWAIVLACDLPFVNPVLVGWLCSLAAEQQQGNDCWDAIVPVVGGYEEPLHALYHVRCLPFIEQRLVAGQRRVISFMPDVRVRYVQEDELRQYDPELLSFFNANTPEEWQTVLEMLGSAVRRST